MSINRKKIFISALAAIFVFGVAGCGLFVKVAANVDGEKITMEQLDRALKPLTVEQGKTSSQKVDKAQRLRVLNSLIEDIIYRREAQTMGIKITDKEVEAEVNAIKTQYRSEADFKSSFEGFGWTLDDFKDYIKTSLIRSAVNEKIVKEVKVTDKEIRDYYENNKRNFKPQPEQVKIGFILLKTEQEAGDVLAKIRGGMDFDEAMLKFSTDPAVKTEGIKTQFVQRGDLTKLSAQIEEAAFTRLPGEVAGPVQTPAGWVLMKVYEKQAAAKGTYEEVKDEIERGLKITKWVRAARKKASIKIFI